MPTCPRCHRPVPANEAAAYRGYHEDCHAVHLDRMPGGVLRPGGGLRVDRFNNVPGTRRRGDNSGRS